MSEDQKPSGFFARLKEGLKKTSQTLVTSVTNIVSKRRLDDSMLEELEDLLITADFGVTCAADIIGKLRREKFEKDVTSEEVKSFLALEITSLLNPYTKPLSPTGDHKPHVIVLVGVNGSGKTTTIGKIANQFRAQGKSIMVGAADTFRAAAVEQLQVWGERSGVEVIVGKDQSDPAAVAFDAYDKAKRLHKDVLIIDTAGRLQNQTHLMAQLEKIIRSLKKVDPAAPHDVVQILDATVGQNAFSQVDLFKKTAGVTGLIITKLDGTARGGVVVGLSQKFNLPIHALGVGEGIDDLQPFIAHEFAKGLVGLDHESYLRV